MPTEVRLQYFTIDACGYYRKRSNSPVFGHLDYLLGDIGGWVADNSLAIGETKTYEVRENDTYLPCYCFEIAEDPATGTGLLTTWNETETIGDSFGAVAGNSSVGNGKISLQRVPKGSIPGFPTYFWINPSENLLVSIRMPNQRLNGHQEFRRYIQGFLETSSKHCVLEDNPGNKKRKRILGWAATESSEVTRHRPRFRTTALRSETDIELLRQRVKDIARVYLRKNIDSARSSDRGAISNIFKFLGIPSGVSSPFSLSFNADFEFSPNLTELNSIIKQFDAADTGFRDIGFRFTGSQSPIWLSSTSTSKTTELAFDVDSNGVAIAQSLLAAVVKNKHRVLPPSQVLHAANNA